MADAGAIRAGRAYVELASDDGPLKKGLAKASAYLQSWGKSISLIGAGVLAAGSAIVAPLFLQAKAAGNLAGELNGMAIRTGIAVETLAGLAWAAERSGVSLEDLETGIKKMEKGLFAAAHGSDEARQALRRAGVSFGQLKDKGPAEQLLILADAFKGLAADGDRTALAMAIFGKGGASMIPFLIKGREGIQALIDRGKELGVVLDKEAIMGALGFKRSLGEMTATLKFAGIAIGSAVAPAFRQLIAEITPYIGMAIKFTKENSGLILVALKVGAAIAVAGAAMLVFGTALSIVGKALIFMIPGLSPFSTLTYLIKGIVGFKPAMIALGLAMKATFFGIIGVIGAVLSPMSLLIGLIGGAVFAFFKFTSAGQAVVDMFGTLFGAIKGTAIEAFGGIADAISDGDLAGALRIAGLGMKAVWEQILAGLKLSWLDFTGWIESKLPSFMQPKEEAAKPGVSKPKSASLSGSTWHVLSNLFTDQTADPEYQKDRREELAARSETLQRERMKGKDAFGKEIITPEKTEQQKRIDAINEGAAASLRDLKNALDDQAIARMQKWADSLPGAIDDNAKKAGVVPGGAQGTFSAAAAGIIGGGNIQQRQLDALNDIKALSANVYERLADVEKAVRESFVFQ